MVRALLLVAVTAAVLACAGPASATTFCVPGFHAACPDNGTNVVKTTVESAAKSNATDGAADTVIIAAGTFTDDDDGTIAPTGTDLLTIQGAGADATILTSSANTNSYVFNENFRGGATTVRDLRIVVPTSFPDGLGSAAQTSKNSLLERVDVEVRNPGSDALSSFATGTYRDGRIYATGAGTIGRGVATNGAQGAGPATLERLRIEGTTTAVSANAATVPVTLRRSTITNPTQSGVSAIGGSATVENSVIEFSGVGTPLAVAGAPGASGTLTARNVTLVGSAGATGPALSSRVNGGVTGNASVTLRDSIVRGFGVTYSRAAPVSGNDGDASLTIATSNVAVTGSQSGDGTLTTTGNIDADPLFTGASDFRLLAGSPSIDAADAASPLTEDRDGNARPTDGNGDGTLRADQGAYEAPTVAVPPIVDPPVVDPPPVTTPIDPPVTPPAKDTTKPRLSALKVVGKLSARRGGRVRFTLSEKATVTLRFTRRGSRKVVTRTVKAKAGTVTVKVRARSLRRTKYTVSVRATDTAGNVSKTVKRTTQVGR